MIEGAKPCPFCGKRDSLVWYHQESNEDDIQDILEEEGEASIVCSVVSGGCGSSSGYHSSQVSILQAWNRRASPIWIGKKEEDE